ncbi:uncharacterized protein METZ01_LOCUS424993, partial [marine metagenome]
APGHGAGGAQSNPRHRQFDRRALGLADSLCHGENNPRRTL